MRYHLLPRVSVRIVGILGILFAIALGSAAVLWHVHTVEIASAGNKAKPLPALQTQSSLSISHNQPRVTITTHNSTDTSVSNAPDESSALEATVDPQKSESITADEYTSITQPAPTPAPAPTCEPCGTVAGTTCPAGTTSTCEPVCSPCATTASAACPKMMGTASCPCGTAMCIPVCSPCNAAASDVMCPLEPNSQIACRYCGTDSASSQSYACNVDSGITTQQ